MLKPCYVSVYTMVDVKTLLSFCVYHGWCQNLAMFVCIPWLMSKPCKVCVYTMVDVKTLLSLCVYHGWCQNLAKFLSIPWLMFSVEDGSIQVEEGEHGLQLRPWLLTTQACQLGNQSLIYWSRITDIHCKHTHSLRTETQLCLHGISLHCNVNREVSKPSYNEFWLLNLHRKG